MADQGLGFAHYFGLLARRWRTFAAAGVLAAVLGTVFSHPAFMHPRYRSTAVVYPVNLNSYSIETRADQLLQLLESNSIRDSLLLKFDLARHYDIDTTGPSGRAELYNLYNERVDIDKTRYESVQIEVTDEDPVLARDMANEILRQVDLLARRLQRANSSELLNILDEGIVLLKHRSDSVAARLNELRSTNGLLEYGTQTEELTKAYMRLLTRGGTPAQKEQVLGLLKELEQKGGEFRSLSQWNDMLVATYGQQMADHQKVLLDVRKELTYTNVIVYPEVSDKKVYPVRWLVVLVSVASALLLCSIFVFLREQRS